MVREVCANDLFERQSLEYLAEVVREVGILCIDDPFFDGVKAAIPIRHVRTRNGRLYFRFDPTHSGRPWRGPTYQLDPGMGTLMQVGEGPAPVPTPMPLTPESLLAAFREILVADVMGL